MEFDGTFRKQLKYFNRTFLVGNYEWQGGKATFDVIKEGKVEHYETLAEALDAFKRVSEG